MHISTSSKYDMKASVSNAARSGVRRAFEKHSLVSGESELLYRFIRRTFISLTTRNDAPARVERAETTEAGKVARISRIQFSPFDWPMSLAWIEGKVVANSTYPLVTSLVEDDNCSSTDAHLSTIFHPRINWLEPSATLCSQISQQNCLKQIVQYKFETIGK